MAQHKRGKPARGSSLKLALASGVMVLSACECSIWSPRHGIGHGIAPGAFACTALAGQVAQKHYSVTKTVMAGTACVHGVGQVPIALAATSSDESGHAGSDAGVMSVVSRILPLCST